MADQKGGKVKGRRGWAVDSKLCTPPPNVRLFVFVPLDTSLGGMKRYKAIFWSAVRRRRR